MAAAVTPEEVAAAVGRVLDGVRDGLRGVLLPTGGDPEHIQIMLRYDGVVIRHEFDVQGVKRGDKI